MPELLKSRLKNRLPGFLSQQKMVPEARRKEIEGRAPLNDAKRAAVLICLYPGSEEEINLVLIRRNEYDGVHSGQISFPGGRYEKIDEDLNQTALREAEEETNIHAAKVEILGNISPVYIPPSNFYVLPVIGWVKERPDFRPDPSEVAEILHIPLAEFLDPANIRSKNIPHRDFNIIDVPCFYIQEHVIWGATAMILSEFVDIVKPLLKKS